MAAGFSYAGFFLYPWNEDISFKSSTWKGKKKYRRANCFSRRYKILARGQTCFFFSKEIWNWATISIDHTSVKLSVKFSSTYSTSTVKLITYLIVDWHYKKCLIERIPLLKIIFLTCWSELKSRDRMELLSGNFFLKAVTEWFLHSQANNCFSNFLFLFMNACCLFFCV